MGNAETIFDAFNNSSIYKNSKLPIGIGTIAKLVELGNDAKSILDKHIKASGIKGSLRFFTSVKPPVMNSDFSYTIEISFDGDITSPSLYPEGYSGGAYDLPALLNHGYSAKNYVYGKNGSAYPRSLKSRVGSRFIEKSAEEIESKHKGVKVQYDGRFV